VNIGVIAALFEDKY